MKYFPVSQFNIQSLMDSMHNHFRIQATATAKSCIIDIFLFILFICFYYLFIYLFIN